MVAASPAQDPAESSFGSVTTRLKGRRLVGIVNTAALDHLQQNGQMHVADSCRPLFADETSRRQTAMGDVDGNGDGDSDEGQSQLLAEDQGWVFD